MKKDRHGVDLEYLCSESVSDISGIYERFSKQYRNQLKSKTNEVLKILTTQGGLKDILMFDAKTKQWTANIWDNDNKINKKRLDKISTGLRENAKLIDDTLSLPFNND